MAICIGLPQPRGHHEEGAGLHGFARWAPPGSRARRLLLRLERRLAPIMPRRAVLALGARLSEGQLGRVRAILGGLEEGRWLAQVARGPVPNLSDRFALFEEAVGRISGRRPLYLEFGVYSGRTLTWWTEHLAGAGARFVGFDSFEGLPEEWPAFAAEGAFRTAPPRIADTRASLVCGWYDETLPTWEVPSHDQLIVNIDCDLYSSTTVVLDWLEAHLAPGALVHFDDLLDPGEEMRALHEWLDRTQWVLQPVAMARWGQHLLFEVAGERSDGP